MMIFDVNPWRVNKNDKYCNKIQNQDYLCISPHLRETVIFTGDPNVKNRIIPLQAVLKPLLATMFSAKSDQLSV
ncbi:MAG: hypothetical protein HY606_12575 [Planctomycetes bacterium]|nr:hypothetical protein [Planctomycetota bacterium]